MNTQVAPHTVLPLSRRQRAVLRLIVLYYRTTGEAPTVCFLARRLQLHHSTVQEHILALHEKGWLLSPAPSGIRCLHVR